MSVSHRVELKQNMIKRQYRDVGSCENGLNERTSSPPTSSQRFVLRGSAYLDGLYST